MYLHCFLVLFGCLIDGTFSPSNVCFYKCSLNFRAKTLILEFNKAEFSTLIEFKYESSSPLYE